MSRFYRVHYDPAAESDNGDVNLRVGDWDAIGSEDDALLIGGIHSDQWQQVKFYADGILIAELTTTGMRVIGDFEVTGTFSSGPSEGDPIAILAAEAEISRDVDNSYRRFWGGDEDGASLILWGPDLNDGDVALSAAVGGKISLSGASIEVNVDKFVINGTTGDVAMGPELTQSAAAGYFRVSSGVDPGDGANFILWDAGSAYPNEMHITATGGLKLNGQLFSFGANDSESAGYRTVRVPNA